MLALLAPLLAKAAKLSISGRAVGRHEFKQLELVHNGKVLHSVTNRAVGAHYEAALDFTLTINEPGWIAQIGRASCRERVYVLV